MVPQQHRSVNTCPADRETDTSEGLAAAAVGDEEDVAYFGGLAGAGEEGGAGAGGVELFDLKVVEGGDGVGGGGGGEGLAGGGEGWGVEGEGGADGLGFFVD